MSLEISYKKQIILFILLFLIVIIVTEIILQVVDMLPKKCIFYESRLFDKFTILEKWNLCNEYHTILERTSYSISPIRLQYPNQHGSFININSEGFRGDEFDFTNTDYKIFFLGGSTTFGIVTSSDKTTVPGYLQTKLREKGFNVTVYNLGIPSATSIDELYLLEKQLTRVKPDMIVNYDGYNDAAGYDLRKFHISYDEFKNNTASFNNQPFNGKHVLNEQGTGIAIFFEKLNFKTGLGLISSWKSLQNNIFNKDDDKPLNTDNNFDSEKQIVDFIEERIQNNWSMICILGQNNGFSTVQFVQPMLGTGNRILSLEEKKIIDEPWFKHNISTYIKNIQINPDKTKPCKHIFDLRNSLDDMNDIQLFFDEGHMSDFGYEIIAEKMTERLIPVIQQDLTKINKTQDTKIRF